MGYLLITQETTTFNLAQYLILSALCLDMVIRNVCSAQKLKPWTSVLAMQFGFFFVTSLCHIKSNDDLILATIGNIAMALADVMVLVIIVKM